MNITKPTTIMRDLSATPRTTGFVAVDLGFHADPGTFTPEVVASEQARLGGKEHWRWRKEYMRDFGAQAGRPVFEAHWIDHQRESQFSAILTMEWAPEHPNKFIENPHGGLRIYRMPDEQPEALPDGAESVRRATGLGIDVGEGVGASDSTVQVFFADNREQAAEYASNRIKPTDLGRLAVDLAKFYNSGLICCVRKMHGITTLRAILDDCGYPHVWRSKPTDKASEYDAKSHGWPGGESSSPYLFGKWMDALEHKQTILHSQTTIDQHTQYIYDEAGRITHQARVDMPAEVRERHGDLVIGCALAYRACLDMPKYRKVVEQEAPPRFSFKSRRKDARKKAKSSKEWN